MMIPVKRLRRLTSWQRLFSFVVLVAFLGGCVSSTTVVRNTQLSDEIKARPASSAYKHVFLIPPKEDPRNVVPRVVGGLEGMGLTVKVVDPDKSIEPSQGTGFMITSDGFLLTCAHVLGEDKEATVTVGGKRYMADVVKSDKEGDMALLKLRDKMAIPVVPMSFRARTQSYSMGDDVFTIGYPLSRLLGDGARMTKGLLSATTGLHDDPKTIQVTAEVQPGNSGGPLLDQKGHIIGIVQKTVNPWRVVQATGGALPQNINFSIKNEPVLEFLKGASSQAFAGITFDKAAGLQQAAGAVVKVQAGQVDDGDRRDKLVVRLSYLSRWDMWFRFQYFVLAAYDFDTQETLFATGQGRDNLVSNEDVVIRDTLTKFQHALTTK